MQDSHNALRQVVTPSQPGPSSPCAPLLPSGEAGVQGQEETDL
jgi:hypothetical protein